MPDVCDEPDLVLPVQGAARAMVWRDRSRQKKPALIRGPKRSVENVPESRLNLAWKKSLSMKSCFPALRLISKEGMTSLE
jgi:hypothetical protein